jgi:hypothetical protein
MFSLIRASIVLILATVLFLVPGICLVRDINDDALKGPGIPVRALRMQKSLTPRIEEWAKERVKLKSAASVSLHDVPTTEWPMFSAVFYLLGTESIQDAWLRGELRDEKSPLERSRVAIEASRDLLLDASHHTWVKTHWGENYMHTENVFFRSLIIAGLASRESMIHDGKDLPLLKDQVETLIADLDASPLGLLNDYPGECYPIDVIAALGFLQKADGVLGTDHHEFFARELRAFQGPLADSVGLPRFRVGLPEGIPYQPSRGIGTSWSLVFAPTLWPETGREWYSKYETSFWQDRHWAKGFREYAKGTEKEWTFEIDAGPVLDGFGTAASGFGVAAARRNGRFDHAYILSTELSAASWTMPGEVMQFARALSHAADAPFLGEAAILHFLTVQPAPGVPIVPAASGYSGLVLFGFLVYFGVPLMALTSFIKRLKRYRRNTNSRATLPQVS